MAKSNKIKFTFWGEDKTAVVFRKVRGNIGKLSKSLFSLNSVLAGVVGAGGIGMLGSKLLTEGDKISKMSQRLGMTTEALSRLNHAAAMSGVQVNSLGMGLQRMTRRVAEAAIGTGEARDAIKELGLDAGLLNELSPEQIFKEITAAMEEIPKQSDKIRLAMKLFDAEGVALVQMMNQGAAGLQKMMDESDALGATLTEQAAGGIVDFLDAMTRLGAIVQGIGREIITALVPNVNMAIDAFTDWWQVNEDLIGQKSIEYFNSLKTSLTALWQVAKFVGSIFQFIGDKIGWAAAKAADFIDKVAIVDQKVSSALGFDTENFNPEDIKIGNLLSGKSTASGNQNAPIGGAAAIAAAGGGDTSLSQVEQWAANYGTTININQQMTVL